MRSMLDRKTVGLLFVAASAFGQTTSPVGIWTYTTSSNLPPFGLAVSETAQVNVFNTAVAASCSGTVAFYDGKGSVIGSAASFTAGSGQITSVTLPYASTGGSGSRTVVRAEIAYQTAAGGFAPCSLSYSLETYDTGTGVTHTFVSGAVAQYAVASGTLQGVVPPSAH
jgi:hypothetical protein